MTGPPGERRTRSTSGSASSAAKPGSLPRSASSPPEAVDQNPEQAAAVAQNPQPAAEMAAMMRDLESRMESRMADLMDAMAKSQLTTQNQSAQSPAPGVPLYRHPTPIGIAAPTGVPASSSRMTQPPTTVVSSMMDEPEELLVGEYGLVPIASQDPGYSRLLDYRRYRLAPEKMSYLTTVQPDKVKSRFPLTIQCVNCGPFDGNGDDITKPLAGAVLSFLKVLSMEANASNLTEADVRAGFTTLVGPNVGAALLREGLKTGTRVHSYCGVVAWLLMEYGMESDLRLAASRMGSFRQALDETPRHFYDRLLSAMGNLKSAEELKGQFMFGASPAAQASLKALKRSFMSSWEDLVSAAEAGDIGQRRPVHHGTSGMPRHTVGVIESSTARGDIGCRKTSRQLTDGGPEGFVANGPPGNYAQDEEADQHAFTVQQFLLTESRQPRGDLTCYLCFRPGHVVADCDLLPEKEMRELLQRRRDFMTRRSEWTRTKRFIPRTLAFGDHNGAHAGRPEGRRQGF